MIDIPLLTEKQFHKHLHDFINQELCKYCRYQKGSCPNPYIKTKDGDAWYCLWFEVKQKNK